MKRLLITNVFPPHIGGSGRWLWELYRRLPREEFVIAAGTHPRQAEFDEQHNLESVRLQLAMTDIGIVKSWRQYLKLYRQLVRIVRHESIGQIHCGTILPEGWLAWMLRRRFGVPYICYVHGEETSVMKQSRELTWMSRRVLNAAARIVVNSRNTARVLQAEWSIPAEKLQIMHPGVDLKRFVPAARNEEIRQSLGWDDRTVVLTVGRLQERKGQDHLILALKRVIESVPNVLYSIAGDGDRRAYLQKLVAENQLEKHVQFLGDIGDDQLVKCYQQCDLFALPNRTVGADFEGFGMVLLEAQACGKPVLAGTSGGTAETMIAGETGRLVNCEQVDVLAQSLVEMLNDRNRLSQMGAAGRTWVEQNFDWEFLANQAAKLFSHSPAKAVRPGIQADSAQNTNPRIRAIESQERVAVSSKS